MASQVYSALPEDITASSYVGFDSITRQIEHKLLKRGFQFNVIVVGQTGLGKSTLINTLFASHLVDSKGRTQPEDQGRSTTEIHSQSHGGLLCKANVLPSDIMVVIVENGVRLRLNIVDTPGYGDLINNEGCWDPIIKYVRAKPTSGCHEEAHPTLAMQIKDQHSSFLRKELTAMRDRYIPDTRIHCCLFFINPTGHTLKPIDLVVLKKLAEVVNVVPVIAKADSLTLEERALFKQRVVAELQHNNIRLYPFDAEENDDEEIQLNERIRDMVPFAVVGSERNVVIDGKSVRGRKNRWGTINVEDEKHCEFVYLRNFLTRTHLQDLIETTAQIHYETFRSKQLLALKESSAKAQQAANSSI
ncbi:septin 3/9/12, partial [Tremellales sp. Uapishka_1]